MSKHFLNIHRRSATVRRIDAPECDIAGYRLYYGASDASHAQIGVLQT